jgi:hypothetical protein
MFNLTGQLVFQPKRPKDFRKQNKLDTLVLELRECDDISKYFIKQIVTAHGPWTNLASPMFGMHVTVVRGNGDRFDSSKLAALNGKQLTIAVDPLSLERTPWSKDNPGFWTLRVISPAIEKLRAELGVKPIFPFKPHLTVARESGTFFMHSKDPKNVLIVAKQAASLIPERGGNQQLKQELQAFINAYRVDVSLSAKSLTALIYKYLAFPNKDWEYHILNLFKKETVK